MRYFGQDNVQPIVLLADVHRRIKTKYLSKAQIKQDDKKALIMEKFFQNLKTYYSTSDSSKIDQIPQLDREFFDAIESRVTGSGTRAIQNFFRSVRKNSAKNKEGIKFEQNIGKIILAALTGGEYKANVNAANVTGQDKTVASQNMQQFARDVIHISGYDNNNQAITEVAKDIEERAKTDAILKADNALKKAFPKTVRKGSSESGYIPYFQDVDQKTDMNNNNIELSFWMTDYTPETKQALEYIQKATFTIKSYKKGAILTIGGTNPVRAFFSTLESVGINDYATLASGFLHSFALMHLLETNTGNTSQKARANQLGPHIYHVRFIYELAGVGQKAKTDSGLKDLSTADFLLYNENTKDGSIFVYSTKMITNKIFEQIDNANQYSRKNPFKGSMIIKLDWLGHENT